MTALSVNLNKIALLRNSRGRDYPNVVLYANKLIGMGVAGITVHPRQDERHITRADTLDLSDLVRDFDDVEFNVEGYPSEEFLQLIERSRPDQCTLVPDTTEQLTSDHGWSVEPNLAVLTPALKRIHGVECRAALFLDPDCDEVRAAAQSGYDRIELYTEQYANTYASAQQDVVLEKYKSAKDLAVSHGLGVNAGHDLDLINLEKFLSIGNILEVSIGHALTVESIDRGLATVVAEYLEICRHG